MGTGKFRVTTQTLYVLSALVSAKDEISGADIARLTKLPSGTLYPLLMRLEHHKWIDSEWEDGDPRKLGRPRRRLYRITALGSRSARKELEEIKPVIERLAWGIS
jgi:PadR family transcriptional regulator, regulatory protein PadR